MMGLAPYLTQSGESGDVDRTITFKSITGLSGYRFGSDGSVWSRYVKGVRGRLGVTWSRITGGLDPRGYVILRLRDDYGSVLITRLHRMILTAFVGPCPPGLMACHNDGDPTNNRVENLRWDTRESNYADSERHGTACIGMRNGQAKLRNHDIPVIREMLGAGFTQQQIADRFGVAQNTISRIGGGKIWTNY